jgi:hypothetical protein
VIIILQRFYQLGDWIFLAMPSAQAPLCMCVKKQCAQNPNSRFHSLLQQYKNKVDSAGNRMQY